MPQQVEAILRPLSGVSDRVKATAWDAFYQNDSPERFIEAITPLPLPDEIKAQLYDLKVQDYPVRVSGQTALKGPMPLIDRALNALPSIGGAVGGAIGAAGGTAFGLGFGGVPGALGGAGFGGATGEAIRQQGRRILGRGAPQTALAAAKDIGTEGAIQGAIEGGGQLLAPGIAAGARALYRGYLKPSLSERLLPKAREIVETALREGIAITKGGVEKAGRVIGELNDEVERLVTNTPGTINLREIANGVRAWAKKTYYKPGAPLDDYKAAVRVADEIDRHPSMRARRGAFARQKVTVPEAQETKRTLYRAAGEKAYGTERAAATEARKTGARGFREAIEQKEPLVAIPNRREGALIETKEAVERATEREANRNLLFGVPTLASVAGGSVYGGYERDPASGLAMTLALRASLAPAIATRIAILASRLSKTGMAPANAARAALEAYRQLEPEGEVKE